jgi:hypothetical protein
MNLPRRTLFKRAQETVSSMITAIAPRPARCPSGGKFRPERGFYCSLNASRVHGRKNSSLESPAAEERTGCGVTA